MWVPKILEWVVLSLHHNFLSSVVDKYRVAIKDEDEDYIHAIFVNVSVLLLSFNENRI